MTIKKWSYYLHINRLLPLDTTKLVSKYICKLTGVQVMLNTRNTGWWGWWMCDIKVGVVISYPRHLQHYSTTAALFLHLQILILMSTPRLSAPCVYLHLQLIYKHVMFFLLRIPWYLMSRILLNVNSKVLIDSNRSNDKMFWKYTLSTRRSPL